MKMVFWKCSTHLASEGPSAWAALIRGAHTEVIMQGEGSGPLMTQAMITLVRIAFHWSDTHWSPAFNSCLWSPDQAVSWTGVFCVRHSYFFLNCCGLPMKEDIYLNAGSRWCFKLVFHLANTVYCGNLCGFLIDLEKAHHKRKILFWIW